MIQPAGCSRLGLPGLLDHSTQALSCKLILKAQGLEQLIKELKALAPWAPTTPRWTPSDPQDLPEEVVQQRQTFCQDSFLQIAASTTPWERPGPSRGMLDPAAPASCPSPPPHAVSSLCWQTTFSALEYVFVPDSLS